MMMMPWLERTATGAEPQITLRVLAFDLPQVQAEQRLADSVFTPKTGIRVRYETNAAGDLHRKLRDGIASKSGQFDLVQYDSHWLGDLVPNGGLERRD